LPIGAYSAGCIGGAVPLAINGKGYQVMRLSRGRYYGHPELVRFIERLAARADSESVGPILVGDLGQPRGGPMVGGHRSHQIGLDVDIWFWAPPEARLRSLTSEERETVSAHSILAHDRATLDKAYWKKNQARLLELAASDSSVDRIFVTAAAKRELCARKRGKSWLAKIRPWWGHDYHFHVRMVCPSDAATVCQPSEVIPPGDGCDETLDWWFSDEAKELAKAKPTEKAPEIILPAACNDILNSPPLTTQ